jgi:hypothetical protein
MNDGTELAGLQGLESFLNVLSVNVRASPSSQGDSTAESGHNC